MQYKFSQLIEIERLNSLIQSVYSITGINCSIAELDRELSIILESKDTFKDSHKGTIRKVVEKVRKKEKAIIYKCRRGLIYVAVPIFIEGIYTATILVGQIFLKQSETDFEKKLYDNIEDYNGKYINQVKEIPIVSKNKVRSLVNFLLDIGNIIENIGNRHLKELEINKKLNRSYSELASVYKQLHTAEHKLRNQYYELERMAYYDSLTGLPNTNFIQKHLKSHIKKENNQKLGVIYIDLDNFKNVNDTFGHQYGDKLLKNVGSQLNTILNKKCIVARTGGDEFLILQYGIDTKEDVENNIKMLLSNLNKMWVLEGKEFIVSASIGAVVYPDDGENFSAIIRNVDIAVNKAKHLGKNSYVFFQNSMYEEIYRKTEMEKELRNAIKNHELNLYYQPQVDAKTGRVVSVEALLRWNSKKFGWVSPLEFIKVAEETGLIVPIGQWVLRTACTQYMDWKKQGYHCEFIAVNVSVIQIQKSNFLSSLNEILNETGMQLECLELEITESVMMETLESNLKVLSEIRNMGIRIALDDFGTGYSSLNYLKCLPINTLKLDKTFIDGLCESSYEEIITHEIINLAHKMKLDVTAEGVEVEEQLKSLIKKECNRIQGYYFSKPFPAEQIEDILKVGSFDIYK
ncbi:EAL domain-containing protein [Clostridium sp. DJ247]|uniref:EAL domain-containing protein n=1 Tax=Clostridium sp. DJ247 TaxID=2726188 RepID=UPI001623ECAE|nr:EAL domain-containing protein [Clostridium sp. DJ247]MBC2581050.1 EAL domain-containing protein [Clostridium sp. DJ247]